MTSEEKYYTSAYSMLNELEDLYSNGKFDKKKTKNFMDMLYYYRQKNNLDYFDKMNSLRCTILTAFLGLNKESIEKNEVIKEYNEIESSKIFDEIYKNEKCVENFNNIECLNNKFKCWVKVTKFNGKFNDNDIIRYIRNGLLHSNFILESVKSFSFINLKIKSWFECTILQEVFYDFVLAYYSNLPSVGLTNNLILDKAPDYEIKNSQTLRQFLNEYKYNVYEQKVENYNGNDSLGQKIYNLLTQKNRYVVSQVKIMELLKKNNIIEENLETYFLSENEKILIMSMIKDNFGNCFFKLDNETKINIIKIYFERIKIPKKIISNWLFDFYYILFKSGDKNIPVEGNHQFTYDEFCPDIDIALSILKGYLILYRLQNEHFDEIDYSKIDKELFNNIQIDSYNEKEKTNKDNILNTFLKYRKQGKNNNLDNIELYLKIYCIIIRDALAHGNVEINHVNNKKIITFRDINPKTKKTRVIYMTLEDLNKFLSSECFKPEYCYTNNINFQRSR